MLWRCLPLSVFNVLSLDCDDNPTVSSMVMVQSRNKLSSWNICFRVRPMSVHSWSCSCVKWCGTHTVHTRRIFKSSASMEWTLPTRTSIIWLSCCTVNEWSVRIRVATVFTIISVLTVCKWLELSACSVVRLSLNSSYHLNTLDRVIASVPYAFSMMSYVYMDDFPRFTRRSIATRCFIISSNFMVFEFFFLYYIHCGDKSNNFL